MAEEEQLPILTLLNEFGVFENEVEISQQNLENEPLLSGLSVYPTEQLLTAPEVRVNQSTGLENVDALEASDVPPNTPDGPRETAQINLNIPDTPTPVSIVRESRTRRFPAFFKDYNLF